MIGSGGEGGRERRPAHPPPPRATRPLLCREVLCREVRSSGRGRTTGGRPAAAGKPAVGPRTGPALQGAADAGRLVMQAVDLLARVSFCLGAEPRPQLVHLNLALLRVRQQAADLQAQ